MWLYEIVGWPELALLRRAGGAAHLAAGQRAGAPARLDNPDAELNTWIVGLGRAPAACAIRCSCSTRTSLSRATLARVLGAHVRAVADGRAAAQWAGSTGARLQPADHRRLRAVRIGDGLGRVDGGPAARAAASSPASPMPSTRTRWCASATCRRSTSSPARSPSFALDRCCASARLALAACCSPRCASLQALTSNYLLVMTAIAMAAAVAVRPDVGARRSSARWPAPRRRCAGVLLAPFLYPYWLAHTAAGTRAHVRRRRDVLRHVARLARHRRHPALRAWSHDWFGAPSALFPGITVTLMSARDRRRDGVARSPRPHGAGHRRRRRWRCRSVRTCPAITGCSTSCPSSKGSASSRASDG